MYFAELHKSHLDYLAPIRHWNNLKLAFHEENIFIKDFSNEQITDVVLLQIPHLVIYELKDQLLFRSDKLVPSKKMPTALLWTPILNALTLDAPKYNMNYFGIEEKITFKLGQSEEVQEPYGLLVKLERIKSYIETLSQIRLQALKWVIINDSVLFLGNPILPIKGKTFWKKDNALLPTGFDMEFPILFSIVQEKLNPKQDCLIMYQDNNTYLSIPFSDFKPLSISSFRLTLSKS